MKARRIRIHTGDVFLAPFDTENAIYSEEWDCEWIPQYNEECYVMMNIGMAKWYGPLIALFDGVYHYGVDTDNIDVSELKVLAIFCWSPRDFTIGMCKRIDNQLIPANMPYMTYTNSYRSTNYVFPSAAWNNDYKIEYTGDTSFLSSPGRTKGGALYWIAHYFIKGIRLEYLNDPDIDEVKVRPEAAVYKFFPEAKNNPNWVISQLGEEPDLQDREKYTNR